ncbi:FAD/NAD(P)-binding domain-containing protein [Alternaria alternata]|uniref:FAD/NAD(P)-binding domain-containing protein n=1 Tax=Alternaria alternata TaxID=5599 RepID=A0A177E2V5_ALTAL|nr:FAD/NAD(P)-binding domain-containing protein [Alternaria alternata]XP_051584624.1 uncharacterized protein J4E82_009373 [Alternaria postmessia]KAI5371921.1 hypothetical protein J4E82_009373 [Alternaria postmessia]OAG26313.1 FAD/NAD(P)-binding domain-containing protein [Alternaria alternata]
MAQPDSTTSKPFRVIIVGAGIVGLSLSHALQLANIDHVVLEKHDKIVSVRGAALIIWPPVARIFDQFGILDKIARTITPVGKEYIRWPDGSVSRYDPVQQYMSKLFQVPSILFDRQALVSHLYEGLPDKSYIHTNRRLERIEHTETGVCIHLADGSVELMWDYASEFEPGTIPENEKEVMRFSEFRGIFGVSTVKDSFNLGPADTHVVLGQDNTKMVFTQHGKVYWGITFKDEAHLPEKRDKATEADIEAVAKNFADHPITEKIKVGDLWGTNIRNGLLTVEEGVLGKWYAGRIVLVGDSVHKMTADIGMGANIGIESAVYLCNILHREFGSTPTRQITDNELTSLFAEYQAGRHERASAFVHASGQVTRMNSYQTYLGRFFVGYLAPYIVPLQRKATARTLAKAPKVDYAPTRTINESAEGWRLNEEREKEKEKEKNVDWAKYVFLTIMLAASFTYFRP